MFIVMTPKGAVRYRELWDMPDSEFTWLYDWCDEYNERVEKEIARAKSAAKRGR
jgi:hypothetical protein